MNPRHRLAAPVLILASTIALPGSGASFTSIAPALAVSVAISVIGTTGCKQSAQRQSGAGASDVSEAELEAELEAHPELYRIAPRASFEQVFISRDRHPDAGAEAARLLELLPKSEIGQTLGDPLAAGRTFTSLTQEEITRVFGPEFAIYLFSPQMPDGQWVGPVPSSQGLHLVRLAALTAPRSQTVEEAREQLVKNVRARKAGAGANAGNRR